ncbi:YbaB/EbfC family nucleoid-associated protein [Nocardia sp. NEAU-G5]|uniref:YbaB/EbfC family nucleoid-associated protein n=1 Tax=Nocardia albiluteola TaxID=2842303 RepID=A0ABS6B8N9_9NOCA|nr:YbaB/EbfC family nucleoid-associated protein [Nocardia albiluteola]MBU3066503.1 YbaB/EbfC family nucleoid-associated protein [Nocardia albiluteola]
MSRPNDRLITEVTGLLDSFQAAMAQLGDARRQRDALTAEASVERGRITVVVNASGSIVRTVFGEDIGDLSYGQIARATVQAAQQAAAEVRRKAEALFAPVQAARAQLPQLPDLFADLPRLQDEMTPPPRAPLTPPGERTPDPTATGFEDAVEYRPSRRGAFDR